jgi:aquaporin Z
MRAMPIQVFTGIKGFLQMKAAFKKNWKHYLQEALGLGIFMVSACFFGAMLFSPQSPWQGFVGNSNAANIMMGLMMGCTALFIFYSPFTSPSGSQINPAVTITFLRLGRMCRYDAMFFIIFQFIGGTASTIVMQMLMGNILTGAPVNSVATVPGKYGTAAACATEFIIAFITITMVLFTSSHRKLKQHTRIFAGILVCVWVITTGPISGFGMNPARSFASAFPSGIWTSFWIYFFVPFAGMLSAAEFFLWVERKKTAATHNKLSSTINV